MNFPEREIAIFLFEAQPGAVLSKDVHTPDGHLIVPAKTVLDKETIEKLRSYHILELCIYDTLEDEEEPLAAQSHYFENIRKTKEFKEFHQDYVTSVSDVKNQLNDFILKSGEHLDMDLLTRGPRDLLNNSRSLIHIFDMLHSMRNLDDSSYIHCINVALISAIIGKWLNYSEEDINKLAFSGLIHDIGKLIIPEQVLNKPSKLSAGEYAIMKTHAIMGYNRIKNEPIDPLIKEACLLHHERYDGSGYPFGLAGDEIPDFAKIVAIADVYDAMTAARVYRGSLCPFKVLETMEQDAFSKYDPRFIIPFLHNVASSYLHNTVLLSDGKEGKVILINENFLSRPTVQCGNEFINLSEDRSLEIKAIL